MKDEKFEVAATKMLCPICGDEMVGDLIFNSVLTEEEAKKISKMHNKVVGVSDKPCEDCQQYLDIDAVIIILVDKEKSDDLENPYRTGDIAYIEGDSYLGKDIKRNTGKNVCYMDVKEAEEIGLMDAIKEKNDENKRRFN